jgi:hypothetical protein
MKVDVQKDEEHEIVSLIVENCPDELRLFVEERLEEYREVLICLLSAQSKYVEMPEDEFLSKSRVMMVANMKCQAAAEYLLQQAKMFEGVTTGELNASDIGFPEFSDE